MGVRRRAAAASMRVGALGCALRVWCVHELFKLFYAPVISPWVATGFGAVLATMLWPSTPVACVALSVRLADAVMLMPTIWDSYYWCFQTDGALLLMTILTRPWRSTKSALTLSSWWSDTVRLQLSVFYLASGVWKINSSFLDVKTSCAPIFMLTLLQTLGLSPPNPLASLVARLSPVVTISGELSIAILLGASRRTARWGTLLALCLHLGIALTPPPNNAVPFSVACVVRLLFVHSSGLREASRQVAAGHPAGVLLVSTAVGAASATTWVAYVRAAAYPRGAPSALDAWIPLYTVLMVVAIRATFLDAPGPPPTAVHYSRGRATRAPPEQDRSRRSADQLPQWVRPFLLVVAVYYGFGGILLGTQDLGSCNMYSNLRMHGGTNHLLLPTDGLAWLSPEVAEAFTIVRVERCTSAWINSVYPGEISAQMSPEERALLAAAGHNTRMFNAAKNRILGPLDHPGPNGVARPFTRYTLTALALRGLLEEARARDEAFSLTYTVLGHSVDEAGRRYGRGRRVTLSEDGRGRRRCSVSGCRWRRCRCRPEDVPMLPPPPPLASKFLLQQPYPIHGPARAYSHAAHTEEQLTCFGP